MDTMIEITEMTDADYEELRHMMTDLATVSGEDVNIVLYNTYLEVSHLSTPVIDYSVLPFVDVQCKDTVGSLMYAVEKTIDSFNEQASYTDFVEYSYCDIMDEHHFILREELGKLIGPEGSIYDKENILCLFEEDSYDCHNDQFFAVFKNGLRRQHKRDLQRGTFPKPWESEQHIFHQPLETPYVPYVCIEDLGEEFLERMEDIKFKTKRINYVSNYELWLIERIQSFMDLTAYGPYY